MRKVLSSGSGAVTMWIEAKPKDKPDAAGYQSKKFHVLSTNWDPDPEPPNARLGGGSAGAPPARPRPAGMRVDGPLTFEEDSEKQRLLELAPDEGGTTADCELILECFNRLAMTKHMDKLTDTPEDLRQLCSQQGLVPIALRVLCQLFGVQEEADESVEGTLGSVLQISAPVSRSQLLDKVREEEPRLNDLVDYHTTLKAMDRGDGPDRVKGQLRNRLHGLLSTYLAMHRLKQVNTIFSNFLAWEVSKVVEWDGAPRSRMGQPASIPSHSACASHLQATGSRKLTRTVSTSRQRFSCPLASRANLSPNSKMSMLLDLAPLRAKVPVAVVVLMAAPTPAIARAVLKMTRSLIWSPLRTRARGCAMTPRADRAVGTVLVWTPRRMRSPSSSKTGVRYVRIWARVAFLCVRLTRALACFTCTRQAEMSAHLRQMYDEYTQDPEAFPYVRGSSNPRDFDARDGGKCSARTWKLFQRRNVRFEALVTLPNRKKIRRHADIKRIISRHGKQPAGQKRPGSHQHGGPSPQRSRGEGALDSEGEGLM